jgi:hypothetical protein
MADGFLGRWAKRKEAARVGKPLEAEPPLPSPQPSPASGRGSTETPSPPRGEGRGEGAEASQPPPPPTLEDTESLTPASDFTRFVQADVPTEVKNAAMKKLFADPHFNIMDRLDTYIDDYSQPDPIPPEMLRQLASAKFLKLFDDEDEKEEGREVADDPTPQSVAQSGTAGASHPAVPPPADAHADPDLRLQQDDAPGRQGPGPVSQ